MKIRLLTTVLAYASIAGGILGLAGCSELQKQTPAPVSPGVQVHDVGWSDTAAANFHGKVLKSNQYRSSDCAPCHAKSYVGGTSGVSCFTCHTSFPHGPGWSAPSSVLSHGKFLAARDWQAAECARCHGDSFQGGTSGVACFTCHSSFPHATGWTDPAANGFHGKFIRGASWDMRSCQSCHGVLYDGGSTGVSCRTCHTESSGPENCATCHGSTNPAPPRDLSGNTATSAHGVGAHQRHFVGGGTVSSYTLACSECHNVPASVYSAGHVDTPLPPEVAIRGPLAFADTSDVPGPRSYNFDSLKCANTFCHGNWSLDSTTARFPGVYTASKMLGANRFVKWTGGPAEAACGTCHGTPPTGHQLFQLSECGACHDQIVNTSGKIADKVRHMNGKVNVFGQEWDF